jgi:DNA-binding transcriptional LysR family regulator
MVAGTREGTYDISFIRKDALVPGLKHAILGEVGHSVFIPVALAKKAPKSAAEALTSLPLALPIGGTIRESMERLAAKKGGTLRVSVACTSFLQAALAVQSGMCAAVLPDSALSALQGQRLHRIALPDRYTLCLAWTARNVDTRPQLAKLVEAIRVAMAL